MIEFVENLSTVPTMGPNSNVFNQDIVSVFDSLSSRFIAPSLGDAQMGKWKP